jgi:hypothetical protein
MGDMALGALKVVPQTALTLAAKAMSPREHNLDELWKASGQLVEDSMPSIGKQNKVEATSGYKVPLKPFEVAGELIDKGGDVVSDVTGSKDIGGAVKIASNFLPIPGAKYVAKGFNKGVDRFHRDSRAATAAAAEKAQASAKDVIAQEKLTKEQPQGVLFGTEDGVLTDTLPSKIVEDPGVIDLVKKQQAEELNTIVKDIETPKGEQLDLFEPEQKTIDFTFKNESPAPVPVKDKWYTGSPEALQKTRTLEEQSTRPNANEQKAGPGHYISMSEDMARTYGGKGGRLYSLEQPFDNAFDLNKVEGGVSNETRYNQLVEQVGSRTEANRILKEQGYDAITFTSPRGEKIANIFNEKALVDEGQARIVREYSEPFELLPMEERPMLPDTIETPRSEATLAARAAEQRKAYVLRKIASEAPLKEWLDVNTREEAMALSLADEDISNTKVGIGPVKFSLSNVGRNMAAGLHGNTIMSGHPMLRYIRKLSNDARAMTAKMSQEYITNKIDGLVTTIQKLSDKDALAVANLLHEGDRAQFRPTETTMEKLGFNEKQKAVVRSFQKAADAELAQWNKKRVAMGFKPITKREGWLPGVFKGNYKTIVWNKDGQIVGMISQDTKFQQKAAIEYYKKTHPGATFGTQVHTGLGKNNKVDVFSGLNDVLAILAKEDPKMAELLAKSQEARALVNNDLFGVGKHELQKKGITGNEGNRPWLSKERNAKDSLKSMVDYFETAFEHHELQPLLKEIDSVVKDTSFPHENVKQYLEQYANHISGKTGKVGAAVNHVLDAAFDAVGLGTNIPMKGLSAVKAGMSRYFMGFNPAFLASQLAQPFQMAFPLAGTFAKRLGIPQHQVANAMGRGAVWGAAENMAKWYDNPKLAIAPQYIKDAITYANERGLYAFNELELAHQATKSRTVRNFNAAADFTISTGDKMTKLPTYLGFVELFKDAGIDNQVAYALAEKATESSMVSYHPWERPMMYQKMGAVGQFAGGLTTYKHANMNLQAKLIQEAFGKQKNMKPLIASGVAMLLFAGIAGLPAYAELDTLYGELTKMLDGEPKTIREDFLNDLPEWVNSGAVSAASNLNMQAKWSSADMVPDTLAKAASPHLEGAYTIAEAAALYAVDPSSINRNNLLMKLTPSGLKGITEEAVMKDPQGRLLDNKGLPKFSEPRSEADWAKRKYTGVGLLSESLASTDLYKDQQAQKYKEAKIATLAKQIREAHIGSDFARSVKLMNEYSKLAGPEATQALITTLGNKLPLDKNMGVKERLQGTPNNIQGVKKYENYND